MKLNVFLFSLILCIFSCINLSAQNTPQDITGNFFDLYRTDGSDKALDYIFSTNKNSPDIADDINNVKVKLKRLISGTGEYWGHDLVSRKSAGDNYVMFIFLVRHDRSPITFKMLFYKPRDKWQLNNFKFDNKMDDELEEASKIK